MFPFQSVVSHSLFLSSCLILFTFVLLKDKQWLSWERLFFLVYSSLRRYIIFSKSWFKQSCEIHPKNSLFYWSVIKMYMKKIDSLRFIILNIKGLTRNSYFKLGMTWMFSKFKWWKILKYGNYRNRGFK